MKNICRFVCLFLLALISPLSGENHFVEVPVWFPLMVRVPVIHVEIEGISLKMVVDLGAGCDLMLRKEVLDRIENKRLSGEVQFLDVKGIYRTAQMYQIPSIQIGGVEVEDLIALEEEVDFLSGTMLSKNAHVSRETASCADGRIGIGVICRYNVLFDFPKKLFFEVEGQIPLGDKVAAVPFEVNECGIILSVDTDLGVKKFLLDTGANVSCIRKSLVDESLTTKWIGGLRRYRSQKFMMGGSDFGGKQLCLYSLSEKFEDDFDGILGVDFFKKHKIYIDFKNYRVYIE